MSTTFNAEIQRLAQAKEDIKQAIEEKGVVVGNGLIDGYAEKIKQIKAAGKQQAKSAKVTKNNSTTVISPDDGYVGLDKVTVTTQIPIQDKKTIDIAVNGGYSVAVDEGYEGLKKVDIDVNIPIQDSKSLEVKKNGTYTISKDDEYEGLKEVEVVVDVQQASTPKLPNGISLKNSQWTTFNMNDYDWSDVYDYTEMFQNCMFMTTLDSLTGLKPMSTSYMFADATHLNTINGIETWDMSECVNMSYMFFRSSGLKSLDLSSWDTSKCVDMSYCFFGCDNMTALDLSSWDTSNVVKMTSMFGYSDYLQTLGDLSNWDTSKCIDMSNMFMECARLISLDLTGWDVSNMTTISSMFEHCPNLISVDLTGWDVSNITDAKNLFYRCDKLQKVDLSSWDISNITNMQNMFGIASNLTEVKMGGCPNENLNTTNMFNAVYTAGTFYYDDRYDYSKIIAQLPKTWTAVPMTITD